MTPRPNRRKGLRYDRIAILCIGFVLVAVGLMHLAGRAVDRMIEKLPFELPKPIETKAAAASVGGQRDGGLFSESALLIRLGDGEAVFEKNPDKQIYPASMSKIMTAILAIESIPDLSLPVSLREEIFPPLYAANASQAGFLPGEEVKALDLVYGVMLPSGAEASIGLAVYVAGDEEAFVERMNAMAQSLGMEDTRFQNVSGLHQEGHYSTARDMAALLEYALENPVFREVFTTSRHSTAATNLHPEGITFYSTMFSKMESPLLEEGVILGGKTGYTEEAGQCLASLAEKGGEEYILITAGAPGHNRTDQLHIVDAFRVYQFFS